MLVWGIKKLAYVNSAVAVRNATIYGIIILTVFESRTVSELTPPKRARSRSAKLHAFKVSSTRVDQDYELHFIEAKGNLFT